MTCESVRHLLPLFVYDDLPSDESLQIARHLADCAACQGDNAALQQTKAALDATASPTVAIDVPTMMRSEVRTAANSSQRWRRIAMAVGAMAAGLLLAFALQVEVRAGNGQFTIAWKQSRIDPEPGTRSPAPELEERLQLVREITHALAADVADRDERQQLAVARLQAEIDQLQQVSAERWRAAERDMSVLYRTAFGRPDTGEEQ
jgi:hypothetical protein